MTYKHLKTVKPQDCNKSLDKVPPIWKTKLKDGEMVLVLTYMSAMTDNCWIPLKNSLFSERMTH